MGCHLWRYFLQLHNERGFDGEQPRRITAAAMQDLEWIEGMTLELWERRALKRIDSAYFKYRAGINDHSDSTD